MNKFVIIGATSGLGEQIAKFLIAQGCIVGVAGRRKERLNALKEYAPDRVFVQTIDVTSPNAEENLLSLINTMNGVDCILLSSGIGAQNRALDSQIEMNIAQTNCCGFVSMITASFNYFKEHGGGHIAAITSVAGTRGMASAPGYSATKRFQYTYIDALEQLATSEGLNITFTDIRPGFVATEILKKDKKYPMLMSVDYAAHYILKAVMRKKRIAIIDWRYSILVAFIKLMPRCMWKKLKFGMSS